MIAPLEVRLRLKYVCRHSSPYDGFCLRNCHPLRDVHLLPGSEIDTQHHSLRDLIVELFVHLLDLNLLQRVKKAENDLDCLALLYALNYL